VQTPALAPVPCQNISRSPQGGPHRSHTQNVQPTIAKPAALLRKLTQLRPKVGIIVPL
jgi:hypothetical protein